VEEYGLPFIEENKNEFLVRLVLLVFHEKYKTYGSFLYLEKGDLEGL
jgi:hypothetical protein